MKIAKNGVKKIMDKFELQKQLLANSDDFESTVVALLDLNEQEEITDEDLLASLRFNYQRYSKEKIRILNDLARLGEGKE